MQITQAQKPNERHQKASSAQGCSGCCSVPGIQLDWFALDWADSNRKTSSLSLSISVCVFVCVALPGGLQPSQARQKYYNNYDNLCHKKAPNSNRHQQRQHRTRAKAHLWFATHTHTHTGEREEGN